MSDWQARLALTVYGSNSDQDLKQPGETGRRLKGAIQIGYSLEAVWGWATHVDLEPHKPPVMDDSGG